MRACQLLVSSFESSRDGCLAIGGHAHRPFSRLGIEPGAFLAFSLDARVAPQTILTQFHHDGARQGVGELITHLGLPIECRQPVRLSTMAWTLTSKASPV